MAPLGALSQAWVSAEAFSPLGWQMRGLWRFGGLWVALSEGSVHMDQAPWRLKRRPTSMSDLGQGWSVRRLSRFTGTLRPPISQQLAASGAKSGGGLRGNTTDRSDAVLQLRAVDQPGGDRRLSGASGVWRSSWPDAPAARIDRDLHPRRRGEIRTSVEWLAHFICAGAALIVADPQGSGSTNHRRPLPMVGRTYPSLSGLAARCTRIR
jgi:hypothetical protein